VAANGEAAWELLTQIGPFAVVVSDVDMPKMDGYELLSKIRTTVGLGKLPVVLVTALDSDSERARARELGASAFLGKGEFDQARLLELIEELT
jgi:two-component system chemotaxis sensor kinase CheA